MKITLQEISIREVAESYIDNSEEGVVGFGGKLNIRPPYQREFVYKDKQRDSVIETIRKKFPLNVMYWVVNDDGTYEVLDGQQRTISFCQYVSGQFSVNFDEHAKAFHNLTELEKQQIFDYKLMVYLCEGDDREKLDWFRIINIAGEKLTDQELRNAVYTGPWLSDAKLKFSKSNCAAYLLARDYVNGSPIRQDFLETAIKWLSKGDIERYMSEHQHALDAGELWTYFKNVIEWVQCTFYNYRKEMKGIDWGGLYDQFHEQKFDATKLEEDIRTLMMDDDVSNKKGIYSYLLTHHEKYLSIRVFTDGQRRSSYERQDGNCSKCGKPCKLQEMEADHITPWSKGGKTIPENCQMLCRDCNRRKSNV